MFLNSPTQNYTIIQISEQLLGKVVEKIDEISLKKETLKTTNDDFYFIITNSQNSFWKNISHLIQDQYQEDSISLYLNQKIVLGILIISIIF